MNLSSCLLKQYLVVIGARVLFRVFRSGKSTGYYVLGVEGLKLNTDKEPEYIHVPASANSPLSASVF